MPVIWPVFPVEAAVPRSIYCALTKKIVQAEVMNSAVGFWLAGNFGFVQELFRKTINCNDIPNRSG